MPKESFFKLKDSRRNRLLAAAFFEFSQTVYENVGIKDILKKADISIGSFYRHFTGKDDLYIYLIDMIFGQAHNEESRNDEFILSLINDKASMANFWRLFVASDDEIKRKYYFRMEESVLYRVNYKTVNEINSAALDEEWKAQAAAIAMTMFAYCAGFYAEQSGDIQKRSISYDVLYDIFICGLKNFKPEDNLGPH